MIPGARAAHDAHGSAAVALRRRLLTLAICAAMAAPAQTAAAQRDAPAAATPACAVPEAHARAPMSHCGLSASPPSATGATPAAAADTPYRDRIIAPAQLAPLADDGEDAADASAGLPRGLSMELLFGRSDAVVPPEREYGLGLSGFVDSADYGSFSLDGALLRSERGNRSRLRGAATLWQRGLRMPGGWRVDNGLGVLNTPLPAVLREQYRFFVPSLPYLGLSSSWDQATRGTQWQFALGRGGGFETSRLRGFDTAEGRLLSLGGQWRQGGGHSTGATLLLTDGALGPRSRGGAGGADADGDSRALLLAQRWQGAQDSWQLNLLGSRDRRDGRLDDGIGVWLDARAQRGRTTHRYGAFRLAPDLRWGALPLADDALGGYYRVEHQRGRWSWNAGLDRIDSVSGRSFEGWYGNGFARYQVSPRLGLGGSLSLRSGDDADAYAMQAFADRTWRAGLSRVQWDIADDGGGGRDWQFTADHALRLREGARLSLSLAHGGGQDRDGRRERNTTLAAYGGAELGERFSLDGSARWRRDRGDTLAGDTTDLSLSARWRLARRWSLSVEAQQRRSPRPSPFALDPLRVEDPGFFMREDRTYYLSLRYDWRGGRSAPALGGSGAGGTGRIAGSVYLDDNGDGVRSAGESPAANLTLVLDGRYTVRTDAQGRFAFERVAVGNHRLSVISDNLPLPWSLRDDQAELVLSVDVRTDTRIDIGAIRAR